MIRKFTVRSLTGVGGGQNKREGLEISVKFNKQRGQNKRGEGRNFKKSVNIGNK